MKRTLNELQGIINETTSNKKLMKMYIQEYYNLHDFCKVEDVADRAIVHIYNSLLEGINTLHRLPRFLLVVIDDDILKDIKISLVQSNTVPLLREAVEWLVH